MKFFGGQGGHANYGKNLGDREPDESCVYCGKKRRGRLTVFLDCLGNPDDPALYADGRDCLGYYPIGTDCAKKARAEGIAVYRNVGGTR